MTDSADDIGGLRESAEPPERIRLRLDLAYDGTGFAGWACQPALRTVQGVLEEALITVLRLDSPARLSVAGRTDAGVHARGQVAHLDLPVGVWNRAAGSLERRLSGVLPPDVRVWRVAPAEEGFDARFAALSRRYAYRVCDHPLGVDPLRRHEVLWYERPLDLDRMNTAAVAMLGERDFAAYCRSREGATTIRRLLQFRWDRDPTGLAVATVEADAFCHSMVRALVGAMLAVGDGRRPVTWPAEVLAGRQRHPGVNVVAAHGLTLEEVRYPEAAHLAARAAETRRPRSATER
jgi:tRNA pseudouridine38-40 synthase